MNKKNIYSVVFVCFLYTLSFSQEKDVVGFNIPILQATIGETVCMDITVNGFEKIQEFSWLLRFDSTALELKDIVDQQFLGEGLEFDMSNSTDGQLVVKFSIGNDLNNHVTLSDSSVIFKLCFQIKDKAGISFAYVSFDDSILQAEILDDERDMRLGDYQSGGFQILKSLPIDSSELRMQGKPFLERSCIFFTMWFLIEVKGGTEPYTFKWYNEVGDSIKLPHTFNWITENEDTIAIQQRVRIYRQGRYRLEVTDKNGKTIMGHFYSAVRQDHFPTKPIFIERLSSSSGCLEPSGRVIIRLQDSTATHPTRIEWSNGATTANVFGLVPGEYTVTLYGENYCFDTHDIEIGLNPNKSNEVNYDIVGFDSCEDTTAVIELSTPYENVEYKWFNGSKESSIEVTEPGIYEVSITQELTGCELVIPIEIERFVPSEALDYEIAAEQFENCADSSVVIEVLTDKEFQYNWSNSEKSNKIEVTEPGTYKVTITEPERGCTAVDTIEIDTFLSFGLDYQAKARNFYGCIDSTAQISIISDYDLNFNWSNGENTDTIIVKEEGLYRVTITNTETACEKIDSFRLFKRTLTPPELMLECIPISNCTPQVRRITAKMSQVGSFEYAWSTGEIERRARLTSFINVKEDGDFTVTVTDELGCVTVGEIKNTEEICEQSISNSIQLQRFLTCAPTDSLNNTYLNLEVLSLENPPYTFEWSTGQMDTSYYLSQILLSERIKYEVTVTDALGNKGYSSFSNIIETGCSAVESEATFFANRVNYKPGEQFAYPVMLTNYDSVASGRANLVWNPCILNLDSVLDLSPQSIGYSDILYTFFPVDGTYDLTYSRRSGYNPLPLPDTTIVQIMYFTVIAEEEGVSPFTMTILDPARDLNGNRFFPRIEHGVITIADDTSLVNAGDTDDNGFVDQADLLNIGMFYSQRGPDRRERLTQVAEFCPPWDAQTPVSQINARNIDCNGDGLIDAEDVELILSNWNPAQTIELGNTINPSFELSVEGDSLDGTMENFSVPVMLKPINIQSLEIYGLAFSIVYDPQLVEPNTVWMNSENSWLLENDANGGLFLYRNDPANHQINVALVRTDLTDVMGSGSIGQLNFQLLEGFNGNLSFEVRNVRLINLAEQVFETEGKTTNVTVRTTSSSEQRYLEQSILLNPNPVKHFLNIQYPPSLEIERIEVLDMTGRRLKSEIVNDNYLDVSELNQGVYLLKIHSNKGKITKRFIKQ